MNMRESEVVQSTLAKPQVHERWIGDFYTEEGGRFFELAFDEIAARLASRGKPTVLDAGCGDAAQSIRLARRGIPVVAIDLSEYILDKARANAAAKGLGQMIRFERGNLLQLPVADNSYDCVLCWGVLMHVPEVEKAMSELARAVKPGGLLIVSENNMWSLEALAARAVRGLLGGALLKRLRGKAPAKLQITEAGAEYWRETDAGPLLCREARISWLTARFAERGLVLDKRIAGAFTELHGAVPVKLIERAVLRFNELWFKYVRAPQPAAGNILFFEKRSG
jgi:2-polyprenyl-3-methyl-5-hydroxy-6-metoxy-1,4-benzoquinol methylase